ncbi:putative bifunctional diguanylate cyclase/phosphodiesterase [Deinococcus seoulensis]|uniref:putative bifunctional diguanylate cyclase/phosphodiesterase n=1 Tax=Deinococcus seoulensis TaxID=1837379 RepID=UPI00166C16E3|nr:bifunctional diguanylate cyclase/phosphodiesterase [Deinococcus seoulensis]
MSTADHPTAAEQPLAWRTAALLALPLVMLGVYGAQSYSRHDLWDRVYDPALYLGLNLVVLFCWVGTLLGRLTIQQLSLIVLTGSTVFLTLKLTLLGVVVNDPQVLLQEFMESMVWLSPILVWRIITQLSRAARLTLNALLLSMLLGGVFVALKPLLTGGPLQPVVLMTLLQLTLTSGVILLITSVFQRYASQSSQVAGEQAALRKLTFTDILTGLPGRARLQEQLHELTQGTAPFALLYVDVDGFKVVNATLGHAAGDELLRVLAGELRRLSGPDSQVYRLSSDEFVVLLPGADDSQAEWTGQVLLHEAAIEPSARVGVETTLSLGLSLYPQDSTDGAELMRHADSALAAVKRAGRRQLRRYHPEQDAVTEREQLLARELGHALPRQELTLAFQPVLRLHDSRIVKAEALLRWTHPALGRVSPAEFIPVAERSGLINPIGSWVLREACREALAWPDLIISVNVSAVQLLQFEFRATVHDALTRTGLNASRLELELTETAVLYEDERAARTLQELRDLGVLVSIDDFGSGYSNLMRLRTLPITGVKMDRSITSDLTSPQAGQFARALTLAVRGITRNLGVDLTAEGIETPEHLRAVQDLGCQLGQGYGLAMPMTAGQLTARLARPATCPDDQGAPRHASH